MEWAIYGVFHLTMDRTMGERRRGIERGKNLSKPFLSILLPTVKIHLLKVLAPLTSSNLAVNQAVNI